MSVEEKVKKLANFCNDLGKCFRKLTEDTDNKFNNLEKSLKVLKDRNESLEKELKMYRDGYKEKTHDSELELIGKLNSENVNLQTKIQEIDEKIERRMKELQKEVKLLQGRNKILEKKIDDLDTEDLEERIIHDEEDLEKHKKKLDEVEGKVDNLNGVVYKNAAKQMDINILKEDLSKVTMKIETVEDKILKLNEEYLEISKMKNKVRNNVKCTYCDDIFQSYSCLERHILDEHSPTISECDKCDFVCYTEWRLKKHLKTHQSKQNRNCHFFNSGKFCPFEKLGCKFTHKYSPFCRDGNRCSTKKCQYRHSETSQQPF